jgi:hypothetical protein
MFVRYGRGNFFKELFCRHKWYEKKTKGWHTKQCHKCRRFVMKKVKK